MVRVPETNFLQGITSINGRGVQAIFCCRRHQPRRPPLAKISPGSPAPAIGPGTPEISVGPVQAPGATETVPLVLNPNVSVTTPWSNCDVESKGGRDLVEMLVQQVFSSISICQVSMEPTDVVLSAKYDVICEVFVNVLTPSVMVKVSGTTLLNGRLSPNADASVNVRVTWSDVVYGPETFVKSFPKYE